jgi:hypothetical protein
MVVDGLFGGGDGSIIMFGNTVTGQAFEYFLVLIFFLLLNSFVVIILNIILKNNKILF